MDFSVKAVPPVSFRVLLFYIRDFNILHTAAATVLFILRSVLAEGVQPLRGATAHILVQI